MSVCLALELKSGKYRSEDQASTAIAEFECFAELDQELSRLGVPPLTQFLYRDEELLEEMLENAPEGAQEDLATQLEQTRAQSEWHDPQTGLSTVESLKQLLPDSDSHRAALYELEAFRRVLSAAEESGDQFRLVLT